MKKHSHALITDSGFIEGGSGDDFLIGTDAADIFALRSGGGHDSIAGFNPANGDRVLFDYGTYSDIMYLGQLHDGLSIQAGSNTFHVSAVDYNSDGIMDTLVSVNADSIAILGVDPASLYGWNLMGG